VHEFTDGMIFDEGWALDTLIYHFNEGTLEEDAADDVLNEASIPEDGLLPWSGSIPWHDGIWTDHSTPIQGVLCVYN